MVERPGDTHLFIELSGCDPSLLDDVEHIRGAMMMPAVEAGAKIVADSFHKFSPGGVTGIVALSDSHLSIHIWPEHGYAAADILHAQSLPMESGLVTLDPFEMWRATLTPRQIQKCVDTSLQPNVVLRAGQHEIDTR